MSKVSSFDIGAIGFRVLEFRVSGVSRFSIGLSDFSGLSRYMGVLGQINFQAVMGFKSV